MGTAEKHPVPDRVKPSFLMFDIYRHSDAQPWASECLDVNYKRRLNPIWHRMLHSFTHMAAVGVKGLTVVYCRIGLYADSRCWIRKFCWWI